MNDNSIELTTDETEDFDIQPIVINYFDHYAEEQDFDCRSRYVNSLVQEAIDEFNNKETKVDGEEVFVILPDNFDGVGCGLCLYNWGDEPKPKITFISRMHVNIPVIIMSGNVDENGRVMSEGRHVLEGQYPNHC